MKKIIFPLLMLLSIVVSQEASAALLSWTSIPAAVAGDTVSGDSNAAPNILVGDYNFGSGRTVTHD